MIHYKFDRIILTNTSLNPGYISVSSSGKIEVLANQPSDGVSYQYEPGYLIPSFKNCHSHSFQFAMAGLTENVGKEPLDDFWTWRDHMYSLSLKLSPEQVKAIASMLYKQLINNGYSHVTEFHYLHLDKKGNPYSEESDAMCEAIIEAARETKINLCLVPVLYNQGGFGTALKNEQRRFRHSLDSFYKTLDWCQNQIRNQPGLSCGYGVHSVRAAPSQEIIEALNPQFSEGPIHIHIAEQESEVEDSIVHLGARPVQWLLDHIDLNERHNLVHATHMTESEYSGVAKSGSQIILCPSTEANLGDGPFNLKLYMNQNGHWSIGSDSHIGINPTEEIRWLDYQARLLQQKRNPFCVGPFEDSGDKLFYQNWLGGQRCFQSSQIEYFERGTFLNGIVLDKEHHSFVGKPSNSLLSQYLYASDINAKKKMIVNGNIVISDHIHINNNLIHSNYKKVMDQLYGNR